MGLIDIPPYVLSADSPPHHHTPLRAFHLRTWEVPEPVAFPRDLFAGALEQHARLLEEHGADVLEDPLLDGDEPEFLSPDCIDLSCALLVSDGRTVEIHKWRRQEVSFVVQRCRGIVLQLMQDTEPGEMYVVVVANGAASVHRVRGHGPRRAGDRGRLEVVERAMVVEPWEQWHRRARGAIVTTWKAPAGGWAESRVKAPPGKWRVGAIVGALVRRYEARMRAGLAAFRAENPRDRPTVLLQTDVSGEELELFGQGEIEAWTEGFPALLAAARRSHQGLDPVLVTTSEWGALVWLGRGGTDVTVPAPQFEWHAKAGVCPGPIADLRHVPHRGRIVTTEERRAREPVYGPEYWRARLASCLARLVRLTELDAPAIILEHEHKLAHSTMAKLDPSDAQAVLRAWPRAARLLERAAGEASPKRGSAKPN